MQMKDLLIGVSAAVNQKSIPVLVDAFRLRDQAGHDEKMAECGFIVL
jgi:hypothetical protein